MKTDVLELVRGFVDFDSMETGDYVKFRDTSGTRQDLVFERLYGSRLAVGHTFIQNGDVMKDPECVISVSGEPGRRFVSPVEITQHPVGIYRRADDMRDPTEIIDLLCLVLRNAKWWYDQVVVNGSKIMPFSDWERELWIVTVRISAKTGR